MTSPSKPPNHPHAAHANEEYTMPCAEALLAGTLALMTGHGQACCDAHREVMVGKIVEHLSALSEHALLSPAFKTLLWSLRDRWQAQVQNQGAIPPAEADRRLWHTTPDSVQ